MSYVESNLKIKDLTKMRHKCGKYLFVGLKYLYIWGQLYKSLVNFNYS